MSDRIHCRVENLVVRSTYRDTVDDLIFTMFERRHHALVAGQEQDWLTVELVQSIRRESTIYREELSTKTSGPLPFALGYFQLQDGTLRLTTDEIPANVAPKTLVRLLSEFVEPGGRVWFHTDEDERGWQIQGRDALKPIQTDERTD